MVAETRRPRAIRLSEPWPDDERVCALSIEFMGHAWYMFLRGPDGAVLNDTWHKTLDEALEQGEVVYGVKPTEWRYVPDDISIERFLISLPRRPS